MSDFIINGYEITHPPIGEGCTGEVYLATAHHHESRQLVAKHYRAMAVDRDQLARNYKKFSQMPPVDEIANLIEFQMEHSPYYSIFDYVEGKTLDNRPMLKEKQAWRVVAKLVNAVGHAHKYGVIHGNLHPGNILFSQTEEETEGGELFQIKVTDFGVGLCGEFHHVDVYDNAFFTAPEQLV